MAHWGQCWNCGGSGHRCCEFADDRTVLTAMTDTYNQPMCEACWIDQETIELPNGDMTVRVPARVERGSDVKVEQCAWCGCATIVGIYVRADPATVRFPRQEAE